MLILHQLKLMRTMDLACYLFSLKND
jgi:hypothetical protein